MTLKLSEINEAGLNNVKTVNLDETTNLVEKTLAAAAFTSCICRSSLP